MHNSLRKHLVLSRLSLVKKKRAFVNLRMSLVSEEGARVRVNLHQTLDGKIGKSGKNQKNNPYPLIINPPPPPPPY